MLYLFHLLLGLVFTEFIHGKIIRGTLRSNSDWAFLTRFCFLSEEGEFTFAFDYPVEYGIQNVLLYFDEPTQWQSVYKTNTNCFQKEAVLRPENNQVITLSTAYTWSGCKVVNTSLTDWKKVYQCRGGRKFKSTRERWWFFAISHCGFEKGLNLNYTLWMTNGNDFLHREFSADEFYIFPTHMIFFLASLVMVGFTLAVAEALKRRQLLHSTYRLFMLSLFLDTMGLLVLSIAYGKYGQTGIQQEDTIYCGRILRAFSEWTFMILVLLMAKGYTITTGRLRRTSQMRLAFVLVLYLCTYIALFAVEHAEFDPGLVLYLYESPPGYGLVALRLAVWIWFCYSIFFTLKNHTEKRLFYYPFIVFYTLWFWAGPVVILVSMHAISLWFREKTVAAVENMVTFSGYLFFLILTRPQAANKNFPYHVKTTQIDVITDEECPSVTDRPNVRSTTQLSTFTKTHSTDTGLRGPDFTHLFTVSSEKNKRDTTEGASGDMNRGSAYNNVPTRLPPLENAPRPPTLVTVAPSQPPSYDSLFRVT